MLLAVDAGNTQTHLGTFRDGELVEHWRFATVRESTADELGAALRNLLILRGLDFSALDVVGLSDHKELSFLPGRERLTRVDGPPLHALLTV